MSTDLQQKLAGLLVPVFALRHSEDFGIGDTTAVAQTIDFCHKHGFSVLQLLPINETGGDNSPYNAISSVAIDPILLTITPETVPGLTHEIIDEIATPDVLAHLRAGSVDYAEVRRVKLQILAAGYTEFEAIHLSQGTEDAEAFRQFERVHASWLKPYTLFRTICNEHTGNACWPEWPKDLQDPESAESWIDRSPHAFELNRFRRFCSFLQWLSFSQWTELKSYATKKGVALMGDIPFGVSRYSADVWANRELFDLKWSGGAPPETFFQGDPFTAKWGQNWGIPLYNWPVHEKEGFAWWKQRVQRTGEVFHYFRIDHVLGFFRIYGFPWLPEQNAEFTDLTPEEAKKKTGGHLPHFIAQDDETPENRAKNAAQGEHLLSMVLEAAGGEIGVVAEDLGMVPDYVRPILQELEIPGFSIPIFEREHDGSLKHKSSLPPLSLCTYGTHDHQPLVSFYEDLVTRWHGPDGHGAWLDVQRLMRFLSLNPDKPPTEFTPELHRAFMRTLFETPCLMAILMITDLLATPQRFNSPGSIGEANWSQRLDRPLSEYETDPVFGPRIQMVSELARETHRAFFLE